MPLSPRVAGPRQRILLVDDNDDACAALTALLELGGHLVQVASDGASALQSAPGFAPDVVLLDIGLPGLSGLDVARQLRLMPELADTVLVAVTGYGSVADRARSHDAGFHYHFTKPLDFPALDRLLSEVRPPRLAGESDAAGDSRTG